MSNLTPQEVARQAALDADYVDDLIRLGILRPDDGTLSPADVRRARWVQSLERAGVPLEDMAAAIRDGVFSLSFLGVSAFDRFTGYSGTTFREVSESTGVSPELLKVVREAFGYAEPQPDDLVREDELAVVAIVELMLTTGFRPVVIERWLRVCAESLRRVAETEAVWWRTEVEMPLLERMGVGEMLEEQADIGSDIAPMLERALMSIYHGQQEHVWSQSFVENVEQVLDEAGMYRPPRHPPALCFLDLTGYTRLTEERGDTAAADLAARLAALVRRAALDNGGQPVKWLGDGVMSYFRDPGSGVLAALEMVEGVAASGLPPAHVGVHAGPVVFQDGDYFGRTVNITARIADYARPGEVVVSREVVEAIDELSVTFSQIGPVELKGVSGALDLYVARRPEAR